MRTIVRGAVLAVAAAAAIPVEGHALPAWGRKYNMNCSGCHYPAVPRLNATGLQFKWAGYRMPDEIGEKTEVQKIEEYLAARARLRYEYEKVRNEPAARDAVVVPSASLWAAGPFGKRFGGFVEFEREEEGTIDLTTEVSAIWGRQSSYAGVRAGAGHLLYGGAIAGFDRPTGIVAPLPLAEATTGAVPFLFSGDVAGVEAFYVLGGRNRLSARLVNSMPDAAPLVGEATPAARGRRALALGRAFAASASQEEEEEGGATSMGRDVVVANQLMWDDLGSGVTALAYFGGVRGLDADAPGRRARYTRLAASANKIVANFELLGGYVYSRDTRLPVGGVSPLTSARATGSAYWLSGQYVIPRSPLTVFGRYEFLDPNTDEGEDARRRVVLGSVLPVSLPEYLRLGLEVLLDNPQRAAGERRRGIAAEVQLAF